MYTGTQIAFEQIELPFGTLKTTVVVSGQASIDAHGAIDGITFDDSNQWWMRDKIDRTHAFEFQQFCWFAAAIRQQCWDRILGGLADARTSAADHHAHLMAGADI